MFCTAKRSSYPKGYDDSKRSLKWVFVYSGNFNNSSANNRGSNGNYWSSTANNSNNAYNLNFNSSNVNPGMNNNNKYNGNSVRCVLVFVRSGSHKAIICWFGMGYEKWCRFGTSSQPWKIYLLSCCSHWYVSYALGKMGWYGYRECQILLVYRLEACCGINVYLALYGYDKWRRPKMGHPC